MAQWYYYKDNKIEGPVSADTIKRMIDLQEITNETLLWSQQIESWTQLSDIEHFKSKVESSPQDYKSAIIQESVSTVDDKDESVFPAAEETNKGGITRNETHIYQKENQNRSLVRFFARMTDLFTFNLVFGYIFSVFISSVAPTFYYNTPEFVFGLIILFLWNFVEAFLLSTWGTTLGKWLLGTSVRDIRGNKLTYYAALSRSFQVWIKGLGLGIPIVNQITLLVSYNNLTGRLGNTPWDLQGGYCVQHKKLNPLGVIMVVVIIVGNVILRT